MIDPVKLPKPKTNKSVKNLILISFFAVVVFSFGYFFGSKGFVANLGSGKVTINRLNPDEHSDLDFSLFWRIWDTVTAEHLSDTISERDLVFGAISGMVSAVGDPYTVFLKPSDNRVVQEDLNGNFDGVGIQIGFRGSSLAVIAPLPGTPAEEAGIQAGDLINGIIDEEKEIERGTIGITLPEAVQLIRGPRGSTVTLILSREGSEEPIEVDVRRDSIDVPSIILSFEEREVEGSTVKVAHVRLLKFGGDTDGEWDDAVRTILKESNVDGVVIDLRNNPGGFLQGAVDVAADFVDNGTVVVMEETSKGEKFDFDTNRIPKLKNADVVILVNQGSASASEILAGALRELSGIKLIGETTFGKGTIQEPRQLEGGSALHITTSRWLLPSGDWVDEEGIEPDIIVENDPESEEDKQLEEAIKYLVN